MQEILVKMNRVVKRGNKINVLREERRIKER